MGGDPVRLGPFSGGLNTVSDPTTIADTELAICTNFEQDLDGSLVSRTPFKEIDGHINFTERIVFLCAAIFGSDHYLIGSNVNGVFYFINGTFTLITATFEAGAAVQYADTVYLVPKPGSGNGGKWDPSGGYTAIPAIPKGQAAVVHKERLYVCPGVDATVDVSRLKFSEPSDLEDWPVDNFIDVRQGDGTKLVDMTVYQDNLLLFKEQSTSMLSYDTRPDDAFLRPISLTIGVNRQFNVVNYENQVYIFSQGWIYEITNLDFVRMNVKVPFIRDDTTPSAFSDEFIFLCLLEDRLICRFYRNIYVYGMRTKSWSEWESDEDELHYFGPIVTIRPPAGNQYFSGSCVQTFRHAIQFFDKQTPSSVEELVTPTFTITDDYNEVTANGWGNSDTGQTWANAGGSASDHSKNGTLGLLSLGSVNVERSETLNNSHLNIDAQVTVNVSAVATGASIIKTFGVRTQANGDRYMLLLDFKTTGSLEYSMYKIVAGVGTAIGGPIVVGAYLASQNFTARIRASSTTIKSKVWSTASTQPAGWGIIAVDSAITLPGGIRCSATLNVGNTNVGPISRWDNLLAGDLADVVRVINCKVRTKNYDMAISHQFKRLWWWGASVSSNNDVIGTLLPITNVFTITWDDLENYTWDDFNTWDQMLTAPSLTETVVPTARGTARQAVKFAKASRFIQIAFQVELTTVGNTVDGPAKVFTMTAWTSVRQVVSKAVS